MTKLSFKAGLGVILALSFLAGCSNKSSGSDKGYSNSDAKPADVKPTIIKEPAKEENIVDDANHPGEQPGGDQPSQTNLPCQTWKDCALLPVKGCLGCWEAGGAQYLTSGKEGKKWFEQNQQKCMPEFKKHFEALQAKGEKPKHASQDPSCLDVNDVACQQGQCVGVMLNEQQKKERMDEIRQEMQRQQGGQGQGQDQGQGQGFGRGQPRNGGQAQPMNGGQGGPGMGGQQ